MPLVPIGLEVEEIAFIPVMKVLKGFPGIAKIHWDIDSLGNKRGAGFGARNGKAAPDALAKPALGRPGLDPTILKALFERSHTSREMKELAVTIGYKASSVNQTVNELRKKGIVEHDSLGNWSLTAEARAKLAATEGEAAPRLALPAPEKKPRTRGATGSARQTILDLLRDEPSSVTRLALRDRMVERGFTQGTMDGALHRLVTDDHVRRDRQGGIKITPKGRKANIAAPATQE